MELRVAANILDFIYPYILSATLLIYKKVQKDRTKEIL